MPTTTTLQVSTRGEREIVMTRIFDAPRSLVFEAMTTPELVQRWLLGPPGWSMEVCQIDLRPGGAYRYLWHNVDGSSIAMRGVFREILAPERIVNTQCMEFGCEPQKDEAVGTAVLTEEAGKTRLTVTVLYPSKEARDATIASGMEHGAAASYERLAELLAATSRRGA